jgi:hypothetical protein
MLRDDEPAIDAGPGVATLISDEQFDWFDWGCRCRVDEADALNHAILLAVNRCLQRNGRDVSLLDQTPLYDCIDPDALENLLADQEHAPVEVTFTYERHEVAVSSEGEVTVRDEATVSD